MPPHDVLERLRLVCLELPNEVEERAWAVTRWVMRKQNFAQVLWPEAAWPPARAWGLGRPGPECVLTFRLRLKPADLTRAGSRISPTSRSLWLGRGRDVAGRELSSVGAEEVGRAGERSDIAGPWRRISVCRTEGRKGGTAFGGSRIARSVQPLAFGPGSPPPDTRAGRGPHAEMEELCCRVRPSGKTTAKSACEQWRRATS